MGEVGVDRTKHGLHPGLGDRGAGESGHQGGGVPRLDTDSASESCAECERVRAVSRADRRGDQERCVSHDRVLEYCVAGQEGSHHAVSKMAGRSCAATRMRLSIYGRSRYRSLANACCASTASGAFGSSFKAAVSADCATE